MAKKDELTPHMKEVLERFRGPEFALPFGKDVRTCEALERRGLMEGELVPASARRIAGGMDYTLRRAYRVKMDTTTTARAT